MSNRVRQQSLNTLHSYIKTLKSSPVTINFMKVFSGDVISRVISLGAALLVIRGLSVSDYAAYIAFYSIVLFVPGLVGNGVNNALVRFSAEHISVTGKKPIDLYFISFLFQFVLYCVVGLCLYLMSDGVANLMFGQKSYKSALQYGLIAGLGYLISQAGRGVYNAEEKFSDYVKILWIRQVVALLIFLALFFSGRLNFIHAVQVIIFVELTVAVIISFHIFREFNIGKFILDLKRQSKVIREFIDSAKWLIAYFIILASFQRFDVFMLSRFSTEQELANYGVAFKYYSLALLTLNSIHAVLLPKFSKLEMQDSGRQHKFIYKWLKATVWLIIPIGIIDILGKPLFIWVNGAQYEKAFYIFVIFSIGIWCALVFSPLVNVLIARKNFRYLFMTALIAMVFNLIGNYYLITLWGAYGAALVTIITSLLIFAFIILKIVRS